MLLHAQEGSSSREAQLLVPAGHRRSAFVTALRVRGVHGFGIGIGGLWITGFRQTIRRIVKAIPPARSTESSGVTEKRNFVRRPFTPLIHRPCSLCH
ncbi:hypothetical protein AOG23_32800 [Rhizobium acidisoli]|nr:hypothetical protein AOG23_32800 [Rhizobium acidisoli]